MNGPHTHGTMVHIGQGRTVFVDGIPDECQHDYEHGPGVAITFSGKVITWRTFPQWAGYTDHLRMELVMFHFRGTDDEIGTLTSECRKCGKVYEPEMFW